jgi:inorganic triphosphatase YgiF
MAEVVEASAGGPHREVELKLLVPPDARESLLQHPLLRVVPARRLRLDAVYFDTADSLLRKHALGLRLRRSGRQWVQALKLGADAPSALGARQEWESPARVRNGRPRLDVARLAASPLPGLLARHGTPPLAPVFETRVIRTLWRIEHRASRIEVALDIGRLLARRGGAEVELPVSELELELIEGRTEDLPDAALRLLGRGRSALALVPLTASKAERGYRLAAGKNVAVVKAAARGFVERLRAGQTAGEALRAVVAHGLGVLLADVAVLRETHDPEAVHQARVALRRMRSAIRLLDRRNEDFPARLATELRWAAQQLGVARDWDVIVDATLPALLDGAQAGLGGATDALGAKARAHRDAARAATVAALTTPRFARMALQAQAWSMTEAPSGRTLRQSAPRLLDRAHRRLFESARFFAALSPARRHRVRILAKRLRYALDVLSVALPQRAAEHYVTALAELQDVLGEINDTAVALERVGELDASAALLRHLQQRFEAREQALVIEVERLLKALYETPRPWEA